MADPITYYAGDTIREPITVYDPELQPVASVGPITGGLIIDNTLVGSSVTLSSSEPGADWPNGVYVLVYTIPDDMQPSDEYYVALKLGDINRTIKTKKNIVIEPKVL